YHLELHCIFGGKLTGNKVVTIQGAQGRLKTGKVGGAIHEVARGGEQLFRVWQVFGIVDDRQIAFSLSEGIIQRPWLGTWGAVRDAHYAHMPEVIAAGEGMFEGFDGVGIIFFEGEQDLKLSAGIIKPVKR